MSDDLHLNEIECVRLLVSANQEVNLDFTSLSQVFTDSCSYSCFFFSFLVGFNGTGAIGNSAACSRTLVHRETRSNNSSAYAIKGASTSVSFKLFSAFLGFLNLFLQAVVLDRGLEDDIVSDIQKYLEELINGGLRQRLISLIKV